MSRTIFLVRHAQSQNNALPEPLRVPDPDITELGQTQAEQVARWLATQHPTKLFCSGFYRALRTAHPIASHTRLTPFVRWDLFEQGGCYAGYEPGMLKGMPGLGAQEIRSRYPGWGVDPRITDQGWWNGNEYESESDARIRAEKVVDWMASDSELEGNRSVLVLHADFKRLVLESAFPMVCWKAFEDPFNTSVSTLTLESGAWRLVSYNSVSHLSSEWIT